MALLPAVRRSYGPRGERGRSRVAADCRGQDWMDMRLNGTLEQRSRPMMPPLGA